MSDQYANPERDQIDERMSSPTHSYTMSGIEYLEAEPMLSDSSSEERIPTGRSILDPTSVPDENGRTYHNYDTRYLIPNDGDEQDRLDMQHHILGLLLNGELGLAPIHEPKYALDIATGTGLWALEFAEKYPDCNVVGTDISKIQPGTLYPNCSFEKEDSEKQEWLFPYLFDYIHLRAVVTCFDSTKLVISKAFAHLQPGGWIEFQDPDMEVSSFDGTHTGTSIQRALAAVVAGGANLGRDFNKPRQYAQWLHEAGFVDVRWETIPWPVGSWPVEKRFKEIGRCTILDIDVGLDSFRKLIEASGMEAEETKELIAKAKLDLRNPKIHLFYKLYVIYGRKPFEGELVSSPTGSA